MSNLVMREQKLRRSQDNDQERKKTSQGGPPDRAGRTAEPRSGTLPGGSPSAPSLHAFSWSTPIFPRKLDRAFVVYSQESQHVSKHFFLHVSTQF